jgi:gluconate 2-dehydrogenase gamma chain
MNRRDFLRGTTLAALTAAAPALSGEPAAEGPQGRVLNPHQWRTLAVVQEHLLPAEPGAPGAPGAGDVRATAYLDAVLADPDLDPEVRPFIVQGVGWLDQLAQAGDERPFVELDAADREDLLRGISDSASGDRWLSLLIGYTLEALLADPLYGGNPGGIGWTWLEHDPGLPRPTAANIYGRLGKA